MLRGTVSQASNCKLNRDLFHIRVLVVSRSTDEGRIGVVAHEGVRRVRFVLRDVETKLPS